MIKDYKDEEGNVKLAPPNVTSKPLKKGEVGENTSFAGHLKHLPDDYEAARVIALAELKEH